MNNYLFTYKCYNGNTTLMWHVEGAKMEQNEIKTEKNVREKLNKM